MQQIIVSWHSILFNRIPYLSCFLNPFCFQLQGNDFWTCFRLYKSVLCSPALSDCSTQHSAVPNSSNVVYTFQNTNLVHNSFNIQQYICYITLLNMFRAGRCSSSGGPIVSPQPLVSSQPYSMRVESGLQSALHLHTVRLFTEGDDTRGCGDTICPPEDERRAARNMLRSVV